MTMVYVDYVSATPIEIPYPKPEFEWKNWLTFLPRSVIATPQIPLPPPSKELSKQRLSVLTLSWPILYEIKNATSDDSRRELCMKSDTLVVPVPLLGSHDSSCNEAQRSACEEWRSYLQSSIEVIDREIKRLDGNL